MQVSTSTYETLVFAAPSGNPVSKPGSTVWATWTRYTSSCLDALGLHDHILWSSDIASLVERSLEFGQEMQTKQM